MRSVLASSTAFAALALAGAAYAEESGRGEMCRRGDEVRLIEVLTPGEVGQACDVRVTRDGGSKVNTPYHANADRNFCRAMAAELASELTVEGFDCSASPSSGSVEAALAGGAAAEPPRIVEAPLPPESALAEVSLDQQAERLGLVEAPRVTDETAPGEKSPAPVVTPQSEVSAEATTSPGGIVEPEDATGGPVDLTAGAQPALTRAPRPVKSGAGRLVGAQPSIEDIIDVAVGAETEAAIATLASTAAIPQRSTEEIVKGVIAANAAAWNEGNLAAFLGGYEQSGDVRLVSGPDVVMGINSVRRHYEAVAAEAGDMGRLSFSDLDVTMTSAEVATVVGRYALEIGPSKSAGAMTVVMKQAEGRWRIVQDTRLRDEAVPTLAPVN